MSFTVCGPCLRSEQSATLRTGACHHLPCFSTHCRGTMRQGALRKAFREKTSVCIFPVSTSEEVQMPFGDRREQLGRFPALAVNRCSLKRAR